MRIQHHETDCNTTEILSVNSPSPWPAGTSTLSQLSVFVPHGPKGHGFVARSTAMRRSGQVSRGRSGHPATWRRRSASRNIRPTCSSPACATISAVAGHHPGPTGQSAPPTVLPGPRPLPCGLLKLDGLPSPKRRDCVSLMASDADTPTGGTTACPRGTPSPQPRDQTPETLSAAPRRTGWSSSKSYDDRAVIPRTELRRVRRRVFGQSSASASRSVQYPLDRPTSTRCRGFQARIGLYQNRPVAAGM